MISRTQRVVLEAMAAGAPIVAMRTFPLAHAYSLGADVLSEAFVRGLADAKLIAPTSHDATWDRIEYTITEAGRAALDPDAVARERRRRRA